MGLVLWMGIPLGKVRDRFCAMENGAKHQSSGFSKTDLLCTYCVLIPLALGKKVSTCNRLGTGLVL